MYPFMCLYPEKFASWIDAQNPRLHMTKGVPYIKKTKQKIVGKSPSQMEMMNVQPSISRYSSLGAPA